MTQIFQFILDDAVKLIQVFGQFPDLMEGLLAFNSRPAHLDEENNEKSSHDDGGEGQNKK